MLLLHKIIMKIFLILIIFNTSIFAQVDWSNPNDCKLEDNSVFTQSILDKMTLCT